MIWSRYPAASRVVPSCPSTFRRFLRHTCNMAEPVAFALGGSRTLPGSKIVSSHPSEEALFESPDLLHHVSTHLPHGPSSGRQQRPGVVWHQRLRVQHLLCGSSRPGVRNEGPASWVGEPGLLMLSATRRW
jgi:hypothetical protein